MSVRTEYMVGNPFGRGVRPNKADAPADRLERLRVKLTA
jgi:hypothetical protein